MKNLFVPYEIAKALKEKGFDEECFAQWNEPCGDGVMALHFVSPSFGWVKQNQTVLQKCSAPLYQQVLDWFRACKLNFSATRDGGIWAVNVYNFENEAEESPMTRREVCETGRTYYEAMDKAIEQALKLLK